MELAAGIDKAIKIGAIYLHEHQFPNGEFCCYVGNEDSMKDTVLYSSVFPTSLIMYSLLRIKDTPYVKEILDLSASFLQFQSMRAGVWNHFTSWSPLFPLCPADVDNTSCASKVLQALNKDYPENKNILLANRHAGNGLFYTWYTLRPNTVWNKDYWLLLLREFKRPLQSLLFWKKFECNRNDIDAVVNANVLFYLGLIEETKPIIAYLKRIITENKEDNCDLWYRNPHTIYYFISRIYPLYPLQLESIRRPICDRILNTVNIDGSIGSGVLDTALALTSLINLQHSSGALTDAITYLIGKQSYHGNWPRWAVYYGGPKKLSCFGSEEMTTAFCLEAIASYKNHNQQIDENI